VSKQNILEAWTKPAANLSHFQLDITTGLDLLAIRVLSSQDAAYPLESIHVNSCMLRVFNPVWIKLSA
jgi:hypothetical protein